MRWVVVAALVLSCAKEQPDDKAAVPLAISDAEVTRGLEACNAYVAKVCSCGADAAKEACRLAKMLPDSIAVARSLAQNPKAELEDSRQAAGSIRATAKQCIEQTVKLPELGCP
jgi:hypothetical protein